VTGRPRDAADIKLFEHPDFEQAILRATEHFQNRRLRAAIIEKDYYVTEALRLIATTAPDKIIFKGAALVWRKAGTSSSAFQKTSIFS
jgi:hypothetical protein